MKSAVSALIDDPTLLKRIKSGEVNIRLVMNLLNECHPLAAEEQHFVYQVWKKHVTYLSVDQKIDFPINHLHSCQKIMRYISKNLQLFKLYKQQIESFLNEYSRRFPDLVSVTDITIMQQIRIVLSKND